MNRAKSLKLLRELKTGIYKRCWECPYSIDTRTREIFHPGLEKIVSVTEIISGECSWEQYRIEKELRKRWKLEDEWRRYPCEHIQTWLDELETCTDELQRGRRVVYEWDNICFWENLDTDSIDTPGESLLDQYIRGELHTDGAEQQYPEPSVNPYKWREAEHRHRLLFACSRFSSGGILKDLVQAWKDFDESTYLTHSKFALSRLLPVVSFRGESDFLPNDSGFIYAPGVELAEGQDEEKVKLRNVVDDNRTRYPHDLERQRPTIYLPECFVAGSFQSNQAQAFGNEE